MQSLQELNEQMLKLEKEVKRFHDNCAKIQEMQFETLRITEILSQFNFNWSQVQIEKTNPQPENKEKDTL